MHSLPVALAPAEECLEVRVEVLTQTIPCQKERVGERAAAGEAQKIGGRGEGYSKKTRFYGPLPMRSRGSTPRDIDFAALVARI